MQNVSPHVLQFAQPAPQRFDLAESAFQVTDRLPQVAPGDSPAGSGDSLIAGDQPLQRPAEGARQDDHAHPDRPSGYFDAEHGPSPSPPGPLLDRERGNLKGGPGQRHLREPLRSNLKEP